MFRLYPDPLKLMAEYNPDMQATIIRSNATKALLAENAGIPTLGLLNGTYGPAMPVEWLKLQFGSLNDYAEQGVGMTNDQLSELCSLVLSEYYYLNMAEICLFIGRFKLGDYGQFYGAIGPMKIVNALRQYVRERGLEIDSYERKQAEISRDKQYEERGNKAVTYEEYQRRKKQGLIGKI